MFEDNKIKLSDIFTSQHAQLSQQMTRFGGLDHPFTVGEHKMYVENHEFMLEVDTDMPHVVFFTFNQPDEWDSPFNIYKPHSWLALETQFLPNDINLYGEKAPSILKAGEVFNSKTSFIIEEKSSKMIKIIGIYIIFMLFGGILNRLSRIVSNEVTSLIYSLK